MSDISTDDIRKCINLAKAQARDIQIPTPLDFSEDWYLSSYPDVAQAISRGEFKSGYQHWILHGRAEGRVRA